MYSSCPPYRPSIITYMDRMANYKRPTIGPCSPVAYIYIGYQTESEDYLGIGYTHIDLEDISIHELT